MAFSVVRLILAFFFNVIFPQESKAPAETAPEEDIQLPDVPTDKIKGINSPLFHRIFYNLCICSCTCKFIFAIQN